jgi:hypothetical protein
VAEWRGLASPLLGLLASQSNCVLIPARYFHFQGGAVCALSLENENGGAIRASILNFLSQKPEGARRNLKKYLLDKKSNANYSIHSEES